MTITMVQDHDDESDCGAHHIICFSVLPQLVAAQAGFARPKESDEGINIKKREMIDHNLKNQKLKIAAITLSTITFTIHCHDKICMYI